jgi:hypothetical protein
MEVGARDSGGSDVIYAGMSGTTFPWPSSLMYFLHLSGIHESLQLSLSAGKRGSIR